MSDCSYVTSRGPVAQDREEGAGRRARAPSCGRPPRERAVSLTHVGAGPAGGERAAEGPRAAGGAAHGRRFTLASFVGEVGRAMHVSLTS